MTAIRITEQDLMRGRATLIRSLSARFAMSVTRQQKVPAPPAPESELVKHTDFITNADGVIVGKREVARLELPPAAPLAAEPEDTTRMPSIAFITKSEMRMLAGASYATRVRPGVVAFDWSAAERAVGRALNELDRQVLRVAVPEADPEEEAADERLAALVAAMADAIV